MMLRTINQAIVGCILGTILVSMVWFLLLAIQTVLSIL